MIGRAAKPRVLYSGHASPGIACFRGNIATRAPLGVAK
jgi:hypothetical protein